MKWLSDYADIFIMAPFYLGYLCMADKFCQRYLGATKKREILFIVFSFVGWLLLSVVNREYFALHILFVMLEHVLFMGLILLLFQSGWEKKLLAASVLTAAMLLVVNICESFLCCLALWFKHTVKRIPEPFLNEWEGWVIGCADYCLAILALFWMEKYFASVFYGKPKKWYAMLTVPLLAVIAVLDVASWGACYGIMIRSGGNMGLYYDQIFSHTEFCALAVIFMTAAGFYLFGMDRIYLEQKKSGQYHAQVAAYKMLEEQYSRSERLRHDLKNHVIALSGLWKEKEWERLGSYLKKMQNSAEFGVHEEATGNRVVDVLLHQKRKMAEAQGIVWESDVQIPKLCGINEFDLCVLFGNVLDNAVEACESLESREAGRGEPPFIHIHAGMVKKCFLLEVTNSTKAAGRPQSGYTGKENPQEHGIGLLNVDDVVHKYNGVMNMEIQNGIFSISALIPLEDTVHDIEQAV